MLKKPNLSLHSQKCNKYFFRIPHWCDIHATRTVAVRQRKTMELAHTYYVLSARMRLVFDNLRILLGFSQADKRYKFRLNSRHKTLPRSYISQIGIFMRKNLEEIWFQTEWFPWSRLVYAFEWRPIKNLIYIRNKIRSNLIMTIPEVMIIFTFNRECLCGLIIAG